MLSIDIMGGLGNQLFQIMTVIAYSKKYDNPFVIERKAYSPSCTFRNVYWNNFLSKLEKYLVNYFVYFPVYQEPTFEYKELPSISSTENVKLTGYFQSYKYFDAYKDEILKDIGYDTIRDDFIKKLNNAFNPCDMISLHFRIGDIIKVHKENHIILPVDYYINAMKHIAQHTEKPLKLLYFCEAEDNAFVLANYINPLKELFPNTSYYKASDTLEDWEQLVLMSVCEHHILANSTFSWWGAYLATATDNKNKIICYPDKWQHSKVITHSTVDLFPDNWTMCKTEAV
jgi:hypothetical protein